MSWKDEILKCLLWTFFLSGGGGKIIFESGLRILESVGKEYSRAICIVRHLCLCFYNYSAPASAPSV